LPAKQKVLWMNLRASRENLKVSRENLKVSRPKQKDSSARQNDSSARLVDSFARQKDSRENLFALRASRLGLRRTAAAVVLFARAFETAGDKRNKIVEMLADAVIFRAAINVQSSHY
jgi:hypothetical protein